VSCRKLAKKSFVKKCHEDGLRKIDSLKSVNKKACGNKIEANALLQKLAENRFSTKL
jgi:hypothetical protein